MDPVTTINLDSLDHYMTLVNGGHMREGGCKHLVLPKTQDLDGLQHGQVIEIIFEDTTNPDGHKRTREMQRRIIHIQTYADVEQMIQVERPEDLRTDLPTDQVWAHFRRVFANTDFAEVMVLEIEKVPAKEEAA